MTDFSPRPSQQKILDTLLNADGPRWMGVSAVPGSGKTHILSYLASELVQRVEDDQEVLIVTLVNAAVDNFRKRVDSFIRDKGLLPGFNYRVCTLHSLAHEIVRQRPSLAGLSQDFDIIDDYTARLILQEVVDTWLGSHAELIGDYLSPDINVQALMRQTLPDFVLNVAQNFIKRAKDRRVTPQDLADAYNAKRIDLPLARLGIDIYREYQQRLARTGVDFDDLIRLAYQTIDLDPDFLARLQQRWPAILEDEAQDSSLLQERILGLLAGNQGSWVRVGDPNQAIYETFTTANPENLRQFMRRDPVVSLPMPESGRSSESIMRLANHLIDWTMQEHPRPEIRDALGLPYIEPTPPGDPQPNPPDLPAQIHLRSDKYNSQNEIQAIVRSVKRWLKNNPTKTAAILDARNQRGVDLANALRRADVPYVELLNSTAATRSTAGVLSNVMKYLSRPEDSRQLATVFHVWKRHEWDLEDLKPIYEYIERGIRDCKALENYLWPAPGIDWIATQQVGDTAAWYDAQKSMPLEEEDIDESEPMSHDAINRRINTLLLDFRRLVRRWQGAAILPIDQLILLLAQDLFDSPSELALSHKFALVLRQSAAENPMDRLPQFVERLAEIARNERRFLGFDEDATGFEPPKGKVTVSTMHRAKGLEWDRVYLMGLNNYSFPSGQPQDTYFSEKWFVRDFMNVEAEALAQLESLLDDLPYVEGQASEQARLNLVKERLRLFFVGITRARQELVITWNKGRQFPGKLDNQPAIPFVALRSWWEEYYAPE